MNRKISLVFILFFLSSLIYAQSQTQVSTTQWTAMSIAQPWWYSLEQGKVKFRNGEYGSALMFFEDARRDRRAMYEQMERDLINLLSVNEVRRLGDSLDLVELYANVRYYLAATAALQELYYRVPKASLNNSAASALEAVGKLKDFPEAEYWIGEVYRIEGEFSLALLQFRKAYELRNLFEDQLFHIELLYKISSILLTRQEYTEMERVLHSIINEMDTLWVNANQQNGSNGDEIPYSQASASFAAQAMTRTLENYGINRFLELYRYNNSITEQAHRRLGFYYAVTGRHSAQQHLMFSFLIQNTTILEELKKHQFDYTFTDLSALADEIRKNPLLLSYINDVEYYKTIYYLSSSLYRNGKPAVARSFWTFLASQPQAGEWYNRAVIQLRSPHLDQLVEKP
jgi:hypothetical protein